MKAYLLIPIAAIALAAPALGQTLASETSLRQTDAEQMRIIVDEDATAQQSFMHPNYIINAPSNRVLRKAQLVAMLAQGQMASERFARSIEAVSITGNVGIVMGEETVTPSTNSQLGRQFGNKPLTRRFTNIFLFEKGRWRFLARQASVIGTPPTRLMTPQEFQSPPVTKADFRLQYGRDPNQIGDLRLPKGKGPFPVAVLIHGGCFRAEFAKLDELSQLGEALRRDGIATWNFEYRRLGQAGGGWPGTYLDVGQGVDYLRVIARRHPIDLGKVIVIGHSAGGHLAQWSASRASLAPENPLFAPSPVKPIGVVNLAGLPDLRENVAAYETACGRPVIHEMLGGEAGIAGENGRSAAAVERLPLGVKQTIILGEFEDFVPRALAEAYVSKARAAGDAAQLVFVPGAGHFEIAATTSAAWPDVRKAILELLD